MDASIYKPDSNTEFFTPERCWILEAWNNVKDYAASIAQARVKPGVTTQLHRLRDTDERYIIVNGRGVASIGSLDPTLVGPGAIVIIPAGTPQRIQNTGDSDLIFYCICTPRFSPECYESLE